MSSEINSRIFAPHDHAHPPLRVGVLGAARIVKGALLGPASRVPGIEVTTIAARDHERAEKFASKHNIPHVAASYEALLEDPAVDAVYIPLPAALHAEWTIKAIAAGKHALVEKPFTANASAAQLVAERASVAPTIVMEAYHTHYHPLLDHVRAIVNGGEIGRVREATAVFAVPIPPGRDIRWNLELGGGGLLDVGYYPVRILRELFGSEPEVRSARARARGDIDTYLDAVLDFDGTTGRVVTAIWAARFGSSLTIVGDEGRISVTSPYHPQSGARLRIDGVHGKRSERPSRSSTYDLQLEAFRNAVQERIPVQTTAAAAVAQLRVIDRIYASAGMSPRPDSSCLADH